MSGFQKTCAAALALLCAQGTAMAGVSPEAANDLARKSGLLTQLDSLGSQVASGMADAAAKTPGRLGPAQSAKLAECVQTAYASERLRTTAVDAVAGTLQPADLPPLAAWFDGEEGRKIATLEQTSSAQVPDPQERLRRGAEALANASDARKLALRAIIAKSHSVEMMADTLIEMALAVQQGMASAEAAASGPSPAELRANLAGKRPQLLAHYAQVSINAYAFTYAALGDDELRQYADFLGSPAGTAFNDGTMRDVSRALGAGAVQLGRCVPAVRALKGS
ncbi:MAG: hypothetical protein ABJD97_05825 [Betaproteobacteria bacterium]